MSHRAIKTASENDVLLAKTARKLLTDLFEEFERASKAKDDAERALRRCVDTVTVLLPLLPDSEREGFQKRFEAIRNGETVETKGGEVYGNVIQLFKYAKRSEWTLPEIFAALVQLHGPEYGTTPKSKQVYNTVNYLEKVGRLVRVARGKYVVRDWGVGFESAEEIAGADLGAGRVTEHDV